MNIGILETGAPPKDLQARFPRYPAMFEALLGEGAHAWTTYAAHHGALPASPQAHEAYLITGSPASAFDPDPWIGGLTGFLRAARGKAAMVGICFGHQVMAQAFGGKVIRSPKGWGIGLHRYSVIAPEPWMEGDGVIAVAASHQDQVVEAPAGARVIAGSDFCPFGMLAYEADRAISLQLHPEFGADFSRALLESRMGQVFPEPEGRAAIASLAAPDDRARVGRWINRFLTDAD